MANSGGFSLLECVVALSVASILAGIAVLGHEALRPQLNLSQAARQIMMDLKVARMHAVTDHANYRIVFATDSCTYQPQRKTGSAYHDEGGPVTLPQGVTIADCNTHDHSIAFVPRGNAGSFGTVIVRNGQGDVRRVSVNIVGQVRVY